MLVYNPWVIDSSSSYNFNFQGNPFIFKNCDLIGRYTRPRKTKHTCIGHHYTQTNTNNVNKTSALLQITGGKKTTYYKNITLYICRSYLFES
jgi:hypothetical protein